MGFKWNLDIPETRKDPERHLHQQDFDACAEMFQGVVGDPLQVSGPVGRKLKANPRGPNTGCSDHRRLEFVENMI